jgi:hypothetical protein
MVTKTGAMVTTAIVVAGQWRGVPGIFLIELRPFRPKTVAEKAAR